ncbi:MAG: hypothetical protein K5879_00485 [Lachnospiraceae bacterium]|nr:hypothetical protein [Lachnospiraceae bacterium]
MRLLLNFTKGKIITDEICDIIQDAELNYIVVNCHNDLSYTLDFNGKGKDAGEQCKNAMEYMWSEFLENKDAIVPIIPCAIYKTGNNNRMISTIDLECPKKEITCRPYTKEEREIAKRNARILEWYFY